jgi:hypothetical protein
VKRIDICLEDVLYRSLTRIDADLVTLEDTSDLNTVTGFAYIDELVICAQGH